MKVSILKDHLLVVPETEFEEDWLLNLYQQGVDHSAFIKTGLTLNDILGLKIVPRKEKET